MEPAFLHTLLFPLFVVTGLSAQTLQVIDTEGHAVTLSTSQIATLPRSTVKVLDHDKPAEFEEFR